MKTINVYFNYASKTSAGHVDVEDSDHIETVIQQWIKEGYCKIHYHANRQWIYVNWQNVVYVSYDHTNHSE
jgi:hypothetical protein